MKKWEMSIMFFAPKRYALIHIPASETSRPLATYFARASPHDFVARNYLLASLESDIGSLSKRDLRRGRQPEENILRARTVYCLPDFYTTHF